jgi:hypothetical protein
MVPTAGLPPANGKMQSVPPYWSDEVLRENRDYAELRFINERQGEGPAAFYGAWENVEPKVRQALSATNNLLEIDGSRLVADRGLWQVLRYTCAPRVSEEDLWTLVGRKFRHVPSEVADTVAQTFASLIDVKRFPWVVESRDPTGGEIDSSVIATATLLAHESLSTSRRGSASKAQEAFVTAELVAAGWTLDQARKPVIALDEIRRGQFSRERKVGGAKCDVPIRLNDGRLLALECKVSNGPKNSWKRLQREVG